MWTFIPVGLGLIINFYSPEIPKSKKSIKKNYTKNKIIKGFPYQYFKEEILTDEMIQFRIKIIYIYILYTTTVSFSVSPMIGPILVQNTFIVKTPSIERCISNQLDSQINQQELLLNLRGGNRDVSEFIIKILLIWVLGQNSKSTGAFQLRPMNRQHFVRGERILHPRITPKLEENFAGRNNRGPGGGGCSSSKHLSMDKLSHSLSPTYSEFQSKYHTDVLLKRFNTKNYSAKEFKELARDTREEGVQYTRVSIDEARTILQAKLQNVVIKPTRPDLQTARRVDLDYKVEGPAPFTHLYIKTPVGSDILKLQNQTQSGEEMSYAIGKKIFEQKRKFVGLENGPVGPENVGHIVDLCYVQPNEKPIVKQTILKGARDQGNDAGIIFLNDN